MAYVAKTVEEFRLESGSIADKITDELALIDAAIDALGTGTGALTDAHIFVGDGTGTAVDVAVSGDVTIANTGAVTIGAGKVTLANHVAASEDGTVCKVVAEDNIIGGIPVVHEIAVAAGALATKSITLTHKTRVLDAHVILRGAGVLNTTLAVGNAGTDITDKMAVGGGDKALVRAATIDDAQYEIAAGGTLTVKTETGATQPACLVVVTGVRIA